MEAIRGVSWLSSAALLMLAGCGDGGAGPTAAPSRPAATSSPPPAVASATTLGRPGSGTFGRPFAVTPRGTKVDDGGSAAVNAAGRVAATWTAARLNRKRELVGESAQVRLGDIHGRFGEVLTLDSRAEANSGQAVAVGEDGTVAVVWAQDAGTRTTQARMRIAVARPGASRFGAAETLGGGISLKIAGVSVSPAGQVTTAWSTGYTYGREFVHVVTGRPRQFRHVLAGRRGAAGTAALLAARPDGTTLVSFSSPESFERSNVVTITDGAASDVRDVPAGKPFGGPGGLAFGLSGGSGRDQQVTVLQPDGTFGPPRSVGPFLGETNASVRTTLGPEIAMPADGSLSAAWVVNRALNGDNDDTIVASRVMAASAGSSGAFGTPQQLSVKGRTAEDPAVAAVGGTSVVMWRDSRGALQKPFDVSFSSRRAGQAQFGPSRRFSAEGWVFPQLSAAGNNLVASWYPFNGYQAKHERLMLSLWRER